jgi:protocatechuate 3,4-dioxygenase beta subunit
VVVRLAEGAALALRVTDERGQPVPAARVGLEDPTARVATTDESGAAVLRPVHVGPVGVSVSAAGYATARAVTSVSATEVTTELAVTLHQGFSVSGRVVDDHGSPIAGAEISVAGASDDASGGGERVESDGDGRFTVAGLAAGAHRLRASDGEHAPAESRPFAITDRAASGIEIAMQPGGVISGAVEAASGRAAGAAIVRLVSRGATSGATFVREMRCDERGQFEVRGVPRSPVQVQAEAGSASSDAIEVDLTAAPAAKGIRLVVDSGAVISGVVVDGNGQPVSEVQVTAYGDGPRASMGSISPPAATTTDGSGAFSLRGVRVGAYRLYATGGRNALRNPEGGTAARPGARDVRIALVAAGGLRGNLRLAGGGVPERAFVQLADRAPLPVAGGRFAIDDVTPGVYDVTWRGPGFTDAVKRAVVIERGKITDLGTVEVSRGRTLRGRVVDEHGAPVAGAQLQVGAVAWSRASDAPATADDPISEIGPATSDRDGGFAISGLPANATSVSARHPVGGRSTALAIQAGDRDPPTAVLVLRRDGSVAGTVAMPGSPGDPGVTVTLVPEEGGGPPLITQAAEEGTFSFAQVPEGTYLASAVRSTAASALQSGSATVRVTSGERSSVVIHLPHGSIRLSVELRGAPREPSEDIAVLLFHGGVAATTEAELAQAIRQGSLQAMTAWRGGPPPAFEQLAPGRYSICTALARGDQHAADSVSCKQLELLPSAAQQTVVHDLASIARPEASRG